jgi:hypothetical protein
MKPKYDALFKQINAEIIEASVAVQNANAGPVRNTARQKLERLRDIEHWLIKAAGLTERPA